MITHHTLLAASMRSRDVYDAFRASGEAEHIYDDLKPIWEAVHDYYETDPEATSVDVSLLAGNLDASTHDPKRRQAFAEALRGLTECTTSVENARHSARLLHRRRLGERLATGLLTAQADEEVSALIHEYTSIGVDDDGDEVPTWTGDSIVPKDGGNRIPIGPKCMNDRFRGGAYPGHHITIFARPETGKSALALTIGAVAANKGYRVLYLGNEDPQRDLMLRAVQIFTGRGYDDVMADLEGSLEIARQRRANNLMFREITPGNIAEIDRLTRKYGPHILIVDQMRNILTSKTENMTQRLDMVAQGCRSVGKSNNCVVVSLTQAGDSARNKVILDDGDVDYSNTGIPAACDGLIGIGVTNDMVMANQRMLSFCKNKIGGVRDHVMVRLNPLTLRVQDAGE